MDINQTALFDILLRLAEVVERQQEEIERLRGAVFSDDKIRERYLAGVKRPDAELTQLSIRGICERLAAISQQMRSQNP